MDRIPVSVARTHFKQVLGRLAEGHSIALERHGRAVAYLLPAEQEWIAKKDVDRRQARLNHSVLENERLTRHLKIGVRLLSARPAKAEAMIRLARGQVVRWGQKQLCSSDYISRWRSILSLPVPQLVEKMCGDAQGWGPALRQNSPWVGDEYR